MVVIELPIKDSEGFSNVGKMWNYKKLTSMQKTNMLHQVTVYIVGVLSRSLRYNAKSDNLTKVRAE